VITTRGEEARVSRRSGRKDSAVKGVNLTVLLNGGATLLALETGDEAPSEQQEVHCQELRDKKELTKRKR
jgi:hypothetical protein